jgi:hypothetical protein
MRQQSFRSSLEDGFFSLQAENLDKDFFFFYKSITTDQHHRFIHNFC